MYKKVVTKRYKAKKVVEETASIRVGVTATIVKTNFIIIVAYTIIVSIYLFTSDRGNFLRQIATLSVGGLWAFFLGYFCWRMRQTIEIYFHNLKKRI